MKMYSRAGKSTINQYIAFSDKTKTRPASENKIRWNEMEDLDIEKQVQQLLELEEQYQPFKKHKIEQEPKFTKVDNVDTRTA